MLFVPSSTPVGSSWSLATAILNAFSNNNFEIDFKCSNYSTLIAEMINTGMACQLNNYLCTSITPFAKAGLSCKAIVSDFKQLSCFFLLTWMKAIQIDKSLMDNVLELLSLTFHLYPSWGEYCCSLSLGLEPGIDELVNCASDSS